MQKESTNDGLSPNKRMQSDRPIRYANRPAADARRSVYKIMMLDTTHKLRQLRTQYDAEKLSKLGQEMALKGQVGLSVQKERLSLSSLTFLLNFKHLESIAIYGIAKNISVLLTSLRKLINPDGFTLSLCVSAISGSMKKLVLLTTSFICQKG